jgi:hypothetical protein
MVDSLNDFELSILEKIAEVYPFLKSHIPLIQVKGRKTTGVGMYVDFCYTSINESYEPIPDNYVLLSNEDSQLYMQGLKYGLVYVITVEKGKIAFLELVTYNEEWDGTIKKFWFDNTFDNERKPAANSGLV